MSFDKREFEAFCVDYPRYARAHKLLAPPPPAGFFYVIQKGGADREVDAPLSARYTAFNLAMSKYAPIELLPMWAVYIERPTDGFKMISRGGVKKQVPKKVPMKSLARSLGMSVDAFYDKANKMARKLWSCAIDLEQMYSMLNKEVTGFAD